MASPSSICNDQTEVIRVGTQLEKGLAINHDLFADGKRVVAIMPPESLKPRDAWAGPLLVPRIRPRRGILIGTGLSFLAFLGFSRMGGSLYLYYGFCLVYMMG